jgi:hypothetical protein
MDKSICRVTDLKEQRMETYRYGAAARSESVSAQYAKRALTLTLSRECASMMNKDLGDVLCALNA